MITRAGGGSRADELTRYSICDHRDESLNPVGEFVRQSTAKTVIEELEDTIAERDARIAELERAYANTLDELAPLLDAARAKVPEWCRPVLTAALRWYRDRQRDARATHEAVVELEVAVRESLDQLRACGIEMP